MDPLAKPQRRQLENAVVAAREIAETAARAAMLHLGVGESDPPRHLTEPERVLRRRLRAHARQLGDPLFQDKRQAVDRLVHETAYEHWHRMLFARFLAENGLLMHPDGVAVSLAECSELAPDEGAANGWELAGRYASRMLPQIFRPASPVLALSLAPEHQRALERLLAGLPPETFRAGDSLGWVYQFWQTKKKDEVNASEVKIGADELPAVTQLFTEPYMVDFLLHNSLGAWWVTRHPGKTCPVPLTYLRALEDGTPAAGRFEGWPDRLQDFKLLDPCCGSGHFLVAAFLMLVPMRMAAESLSAREAVDAVLRDNLHGLEIDPRCVEIAVFALALAAWRFPDERGRPLGVRPDMPAPQVACCGLKVAARPEDWTALVPDDAPNADYLRQELRLLHAAFAQAPLLGSLLDPSRILKDDLGGSSLDTLRDLLGRALSAEPLALPAADGTGDEGGDTWDLALAARGLLDAARLLDGRYHLVVTNVPYLARGKQSDALKHYCETHYPEAKNDLANAFLERCLELCVEATSSRLDTRLEGASTGVVQIVMPQNWLFLTSYKKQRESLLKRMQWNLLARLGPGAFETISGEVVQAVLLTQTHTLSAEEFQLRGVDVSAPKAAQEKAALLRDGELVAVSQKGQLKNPDYRITLAEDAQGVSLLGAYAECYQGLRTGEKERFLRLFWELPGNSIGWEVFRNSNDESSEFGGMYEFIKWEGGRGELHRFAVERRNMLHDMHESGNRAWGRHGVAINQMRELKASRFNGEKFDGNVSVIIPKNVSDLPAIWSFCSSIEYSEAVRRIDQKLNVTNATLLKVPFDLAKWKEVAAANFPNGLPRLLTNDPIQWIFHGHPQPATDALQVAVARLVGYRWPAETDESMELSDEARTWIGQCAKLAEHTDDDGIVCLPSVRGEPPAQERLLRLLIAAWETVEAGSWKPAVLDKLLADADCASKGLEVWLRDKFFEQHARRFHHRPFVWQVWDGLKDGFGALVNYHRLDSKNLERLVHTYLGDWIRQQEAGVRDGVDGAPARLSAAQDLKRRLTLILEGEPPYDIFVRWKPLADQPIGWNPDLNDGVRLNIRPFMTAEVLRHNKKPRLNIAWDKDRGKDVESAPWFHLFKGDRINDHHLTLAEKRAARGASRCS